ncbi:MAG: coiled-coil domain-containing protein [Tepidanaerobacteraceae bacterium]
MSSFNKLFVIILILLFFSTNLERIGAGTYPQQPDEDIDRAQLDMLEQELIEEILALDSKVLGLRNQVDNYSKENEELKALLEQKRAELSILDDEVKQRQQTLSDLIVFSFKGGLGNFLSVLVGAEDMGDFFRRLDNILFFLEYYNNVIAETKAVISRRTQEEKVIMENQKKVQSLERQAKEALQQISKVLEEKKNELDRARMLLKDITRIEKISENWQEALPSLDYLLKNLSSLPWSDIGPDNVKVNYFNLTARAEFKDTSLTQKLLSKDEKLKNVYFRFNRDGITVAEKGPAGSDVYSVTLRMELSDDNKVKFEPIRLEFNGLTLPASVIAELMSEHDMTFTPPALPYNLKIRSIQTEEGLLIMNLSK